MSVEEMNFEQAFAALQETVEQLETGELALEDTLSLYERGQALARRCQDLLDQAELRVTQLGGDVADSL
ncbi:MAG TPA: exodeoxyribonuclease VII small subunit [Anaerolineae bacterium]|nr:exodeoxyribonuclease VII small subunit [Anaerolineae bacterium]